MSESSPPSLQNVTVEEYLKLEERSSTRHEFVSGCVFAMAGATDAHNIICGNLFSAVHAHLRGTVCMAYVNDMKLHIKAASSFYYPDIMVTCEPFKAKSVFKVSPVLIVEVLSPSTKQIDRREKLVAYRKLDLLREYVIVHQNRMLIEIHRKQSDGQWQVNELRATDKLTLESLPGGVFCIPVADIYDRIELPRLVEESEDEYECELAT